MFRRIALLAAGATLAVAASSGSAAASTGPAYSSPEQAGYAATGARFKFAGAHVTLPYASRFAREAGRISLSAELWTTTIVVDLTVSACTDTTCRPGGAPVTRRYRPMLRVFRRSTRSLICSTLNGTCPQVPSSWKRARFAPGRNVSLSLFYDHTNGFLDAGVDAGGSGADYANLVLSAGRVFSQARIGAEFGASPWSTVPFHPPARETRLATFWEPSKAPFEAELATYNGDSSCLIAWWARHKVKMTKNGTSSGAVGARPGGLTNSGCNFSVFLEP